MLAARFRPNPPVSAMLSLKNASLDVVRRLAPDAVLGPAVLTVRKGLIAHLRPYTPTLLAATACMALFAAASGLTIGLFSPFLQILFAPPGAARCIMLWNASLPNSLAAPASAVAKSAWTTCASGWSARRRARASVDASATHTLSSQPSAASAGRYNSATTAPPPRTRYRGSGTGQLVRTE